MYEIWLAWWTYDIRIHGKTHESEKINIFIKSGLQFINYKFVDNKKLLRTACWCHFFANVFSYTKLSSAEHNTSTHQKCIITYSFVPHQTEMYADRKLDTYLAYLFGGTEARFTVGFSLAQDNTEL